MLGTSHCLLSGYLLGSALHISNLYLPHPPSHFVSVLTLVGIFDLFTGLYCRHAFYFTFSFGGQGRFCLLLMMHFSLFFHCLRLVS